jgi:two-component system, sensor histidine kinase
MGLPRRVLIVDDNPANLITLKCILDPVDVTIDTAISGFEALRLADDHSYSLVLLDIQMPEMDGFETLTQLRRLPSHHFTPIILISAVYTEDQHKIKGLETGAIDFIPKPVNPDFLRAKVRVFLDLEENRTKLNFLIDELKLKNTQLTNEIEKGIQIARELELAKAKADRANEYNSQLLVNMSHEIRTPVNSILGFADLITNPGVNDEDKKKYLQYIGSSSQNLLFLIDEILEHSRFEAGGISINITTVEIVSFCKELFASFQELNRISNKGSLAFSLDLDQEIEECHLYTDSQRLRQILSNLLNNAFKYTINGAVKFGFKLKETDIQFFIIDSGIGIPNENINEIFDRFKRVPGSQESLINGSGLGLFISKNLIELLGGHIWVRSEYGIGSEFWFSIPLKKAETGKRAIMEHSDTHLPDNIDWKSKTILIAEDEELNFLFLKECLRQTGVKIIWAKTGRESIEMASENPNIDLVLMDIRMPDIDGFQATKKIKSIRPHLPLIIQTACTLSDESKRSRKEGCDEFITKPINRVLLLTTISIYLNS